VKGSDVYAEIREKMKNTHPFLPPSLPPSFPPSLLQVSLRAGEGK